MNELAIITAVLDAAQKANGTTGAAIVVTIYSLRNVIPELTKKLTYPSAEAIGNLFGKIIENGTLQTEGSRKFALKIARAVVDVSIKLKERKPEEFVEEVPPEIAVPIFTKLSYFEDNDLRELLVNLLAGAMLKNGQIHPTIVSIVDRLTTGEAKLLKALSDADDYGPWPCITITAALKPRTDGYSLPDLSTVDLFDQIKLKELHDKNIDSSDRRENGYRDLGAQNLSDLNRLSYFSNFEEANFCVTNMCALGLIVVTDGWLSDTSSYGRLIQKAESYVKEAQNMTSNTPFFKKEKFSITPLGKSIIRAFKQTNI